MVEPAFNDDSSKALASKYLCRHKWMHIKPYYYWQY